MDMTASLPQNGANVKRMPAPKCSMVDRRPPARNTFLMETVGYAEVLRSYFREAAKPLGQREFARQLGVSRQAFNQILIGNRGREIRHDHLDKYARLRGVPLAVVLKEVADLAWKMESAHLPADRTAVEISPGVMVAASTAAELNAAKAPNHPAASHRHPLTAADAPAPRRG